jgi:hypothetical protein
MQDLQLNIDLQTARPLVDHVQETVVGQRGILLGVVSGDHADESQQITAYAQVGDVPGAPLRSTADGIARALVDTDEADERVQLVESRLISPSVRNSPGARGLDPEQPRTSSSREANPIQLPARYHGGAHAFLLECIPSERAESKPVPRSTRKLRLDALVLPQLPEARELTAQRVFSLARLTEASELTIGRGEQVALLIEGDEVSGLHGRLRLEPSTGLATVEDLGSTNGTFVNGEPITPREPRRLADGDIISLGGTRDFQYCLARTFHGQLRRLVRADT